MNEKQSLKTASDIPPTPEVAARTVVRRLPFWEADECFKCPVVGLCLNLAEQKRLLRKTGVAVKKRTPFEVHEILVAGGHQENRLSRKVDRMLERKFGPATAALFALDSQAFLAHFKSAFETGDYAGPVWAAAVNPQLPMDTKREIFGEIHMTMHQHGAEHLRTKQKIARQQTEIDKLRQHLTETARGHRDLQKRYECLHHAQAGLKAGLAIAKRESQHLREALAERDKGTTLDQENRWLKAELEALRSRLADKQCLVVALKEKQRRLAAELDRQQELNAHFRKEIQEAMSGALTCKTCDAQCPAYDLCQRRIFIVGGMTRMESLYRGLIEGSGGIFDYHDGYLHKGARHLESRLRRADVVLCPVSCNSHNACSVVKSLAKKHNKTVHMLANSSLNTVSRAIWGEQSDQHSLN